MLHTIKTDNGGRVIVRPTENRGAVVLGINAGPGATSVRLTAATLGALLFALEQAAEDCGMSAEGVRFCPECGHLGDVPKSARDCCPDGSHAAYMPVKTAEKCRRLFVADLEGVPA